MKENNNNPFDGLDGVRARYTASLLLRNAARGVNLNDPILGCFSQAEQQAAVVPVDAVQQPAGGGISPAGVPVDVVQQPADGGTSPAVVTFTPTVNDGYQTPSPVNKGLGK